MFKKIVALVAFLAVGFLFFPRTGQSATQLTCHTATKTNQPSGTVAECGAGEVVTGGGGRCYGVPGGWESFMTKSYPSGNGWSVVCENLKKGEQTVGEVYAVCCKQ
jgi:hypothetical protein